MFTSAGRSVQLYLTCLLCRPLPRCHPSVRQNLHRVVDRFLATASDYVTNRPVYLFTILQEAQMRTPNLKKIMDELARLGAERKALAKREAVAIQQLDHALQDTGYKVIKTGTVNANKIVRRGRRPGGNPVGRPPLRRPGRPRKALTSQ